MSISMQEIIAENSRWIMGSQALVEGVLRLPDPLEEVGTILDITSLGEVVETYVSETHITIEGAANFRVLYLDKNGKFASFDSECSFSHSTDANGCTPDMQILASTMPGDISYGVVDGTSISVRSSIHIDIYAMGNRKYEILDAYSPGKYTCVKNNTATLSRVKCAKTFKSYVKTELRVPQSMPAVKRILTERGYAIVKSAVMEDGRAAVEGELRVFIIYESMDKNAPLQHFSETIPFGEILNDEGFDRDASLFVLADLERIGAVSDEDNADIIEVSAIVNLMAMSRGEKQIHYVDDMYDEESEVELTSEALGTCNMIMHDSQKKIVRLSAEIPDTSPEVSRVLFTNAYPQITSAKADRDRVLITGDMNVMLCYTTQETGIKSTRLSIPFETEVAYPGMTPSTQIWVKAFGEYAIAEGSGRELEIKCCMDICMWEVKVGSVKAISSAEFSPLAAQKESGVVVYYASGTETRWDIAKKFKVKKDVIGDSPDDEFVEKGKRLVLIRR